MELTYSCPSCGVVGHLAAVENASEMLCQNCGTARPLRSGSVEDGELKACPWCLTTDLYVQKDFPQGLGLTIVFIGFAISTVFWYYEMPIQAYLVLVVSILLDLVMYHRVKNVTICYRCLCQLRGAGANPGGRFKTFDLAIGERYRQERLRTAELRSAGARRVRRSHNRERCCHSRG